MGYEQICLVPWDAGIGESRGKAAIAFGESMAQIRRIARRRVAANSRS